MKSTEIVGSSTAIPSSRSGCSGSVTVSPISTPSSPPSTTISPAAADGTSMRSSPSLANSFVTRAFCARCDGSSASSATWSPTLTEPRSMRPMPSRPR